jgi:acyl-CoA dehydrogenase
VWTVALTLFFIALSVIHPLSTACIILLWVLFILILFPLYAIRWRRQFFTRRVLHFYQKSMPTMSATEREALAAGTVSWEGDLFRGKPDWDKLLGFPKPTLTAEEQAFIDGPVNDLCAMIDDWDITHYRADLPPELWEFI